MTRLRAAIARELANPGAPGLGGTGSRASIATPWESDPLNIVGELYGLADSSNIQITRKTAMSLDVVAKGRRVLATNIGRMQLVTRKAGRPAR